MSDLSGYAYSEVEFDKDGHTSSKVEVAAATTDLFIFSHGWRNNPADARELYAGFFESFAAEAPEFEVDPAKVAVLGVFWPSERFDESLASPEAAAAASHAAGVTAPGGAARLAALKGRLEKMKAFFTAPGQPEKLAEAGSLAESLESKTEARTHLVELMRSLFKGEGATPPAVHKEDASPDFFARDAKELMEDLRVVDEDDDESEDDDKKKDASAADAGRAAGLGTLFNDFKSAALRLVNFTTYFEMKSRAGVVGGQGVAPLLNELAERYPMLQRIHLIGHSFGGRVVTAAADSAKTPKLKSMTLLQAAFSHNGFSGSQNGFFRQVVAGRKVSGPVLITFSEFDQANGYAYPIASRISHDKTAAFGDKNDVYGAIGRNGAQRMQAVELREGVLLPRDGGAYDFTAPIFYNLDGAAFIKNHGMVKGREIARAVLSANFPKKQPGAVQREIPG